MQNQILKALYRKAVTLTRVSLEKSEVGACNDTAGGGGGEGGLFARIYLAKAKTAPTHYPSTLKEGEKTLKKYSFAY